MTQLLDVGANVGQYGIDIRAAGYDQKIVSFEPLNDAYQQLEKTVEGDRNWTSVHSAVGADIGELTMHITHNSIFSSPLEPTQAITTADSGSRVVATEVVPVTTLDEIVARHVEGTMFLASRSTSRVLRDRSCLEGGMHCAGPAGWRWSLR